MSRWIKIEAFIVDRWADVRDDEGPVHAGQSWTPGFRKNVRFLSGGVETRELPEQLSTYGFDVRFSNLEPHGPIWISRHCFEISGLMTGVALSAAPTLAFSAEGGTRI